MATRGKKKAIPGQPELVREFGEAMAKSGMLENPEFARAVKQIKQILNPSSNAEKPHALIAEEFAKHLANRDFTSAYKLLTPDLRLKNSAADLQSRLDAMVSYAKNPATITDVQVMTTLEEFPHREENDVGWAYVAMTGDGFSEAVTVIVTKQADGLFIRYLEWGRP